MCKHPESKTGGVAFTRPYRQEFVSYITSTLMFANVTHRPWTKELQRIKESAFYKCTPTSKNSEPS
jgi:hypothetical protein